LWWTICFRRRERGLVGGRKPAQPATALKPFLCLNVGTLLDLAHTYYRSGEGGFCQLPASACCGILTALRLHCAINWRLSACGCDPWAGRVVAPPGAKLSIAGPAMFLSCTQFPWTPICLGKPE